MTVQSLHFALIISKQISTSPTIFQFKETKLGNAKKLCDRFFFLHWYSIQTSFFFVFWIEISQKPQKIYLFAENWICCCLLYSPELLLAFPLQKENFLPWASFCFLFFYWSVRKEKIIFQKKRILTLLSRFPLLAKSYLFCLHQNCIFSPTRPP